MGGIGNQLFQYAAGRALAEKHMTELALHADLLERDFENVTPRQYSLSAFRIRERFASEAEIERLTLRRGVVDTALRILARVGPRSNRREYFEKSSAYDPAFQELGAQVYLAGYFQSEQYFSPIRDILRHEVQLKKPGSAAASAMAEAIRNQSAPVSIHFRRGDYLTNPVAAGHHGVLPPEYFSAAKAEMSSRVTRPHYFVFSDEPDWAETHMNGDNYTIVGGEGKTDAEDMMLIAACRHHIISNSSFSWWGAWLSDNEEKVVIAPKQWFASAREDSSDIVPAGWLRI